MLVLWRGGGGTCDVAALQGQLGGGCTQMCLFWYPAGLYRMGQGYRHT